MENLNAVIFDMDGVIFNTEKIWQKAYKYANKRFGIKIPEKQRQEFCGMKWNEQLEVISQKYSNEIAKKYIEFVRLYGYLVHNDKTTLKSGFCELVKFLKSKNLKIGLATGSNRSRVDFSFKSVQINVEEVFDVIATSENVTHSKPSPEIYNYALKNLNEKPENCIVLEDSINGIRSSTGAKIPTIMVQDIIKPSNEVKKLCLKIFKNLNQVQRFLEKNV